MLHAHNKESLKQLMITPNGADNNGHDVMGDLLSQSPPIGRLKLA